MRKRRAIQNARAMLVWGVGFFLAAQLGMNLVIELRNPEVFDPEYGVHLKLLRERRAENPDRPLLLVVGSSRTEQGFLPEQLPPLRDADGRTVLPFNFSHLGAGPGVNLLAVQRLLKEGLLPDWLVIEIMPSTLGEERQRMMARVASAADLPLVARYFSSVEWLGTYLRGRLIPWYKHRLFVRHKWAPRWDPIEAWHKNRIPLGPLGGDYCWWGTQPPTSAATVRHHIEVTRGTYFLALQKLQVSAFSDQALRELLELCRSHGIKTTLLLTPEGSEFRSWYPPEARERVDAYCAALACEFEVGLIDARAWLDDADFYDGHHVHLQGAARFTERLGREVLEPFVRGTR